MERVRAHVFISGDVQGVGFRSFVYNNALSLGVKGFVRNLNDGRVEAVFEGEKSKVERMIDLCRKGPLLAWVRDV
ncbi:MAG TPA: acylphosphatase, partial [Candidatus Aenigmarchaeota archaeon]|nr:acylphosphatase [Candidatus Aenigmarchaeota archaeon]